MSYKYLIGSIIAKGEMYNVPKAKGYELLEEVAANGNLFSKMVMALLFLDGAPGLPFQCDRATKYFMAEGIHHPFFIVYLG